MPEGYAPFEHVTRVAAIREFVDWLYDASPEPPSMPREKLVRSYWERVSEEALQGSTAVEADEPIPFGPGSLLTFPGTRTDLT